MANADDQLYGLALEQFVPERAAMAKSLRADGEREEAARVAKLPKPSVAAWAVNQLVRTQKEAVEELFAAGDALIAAQSALLSGSGDGDGLRDAVQRERAAVDGLVKTARGLLSSSGSELSQTMLDRISGTLNAAALDEEARAHVRDGCLVRELQHVGFAGGLGAAAATPPPPRTTKRAAAAAPKRESGRSAKEIRDAARKAEKERAGELRAAKHAEADARRAAELAVRKREVATDRRDRAAEALAQAEHALEEAQASAEKTAAVHGRAAAELERRQSGA
jgi:hypothetical protein